MSPRRACWFTVLLACCVFATPAAAQHEGGTVWVEWQLPYVTETFTQPITPHLIAPATRWGAEVWHETAEQPTYVSISDQGDAGQFAQFTMSGVEYAIPGSDEVVCLQQGADGQLCMADFPLVWGHTYWLSVFHLANGNWTASVTDRTSMYSQQLGEMVPSVQPGNLYASRAYGTYFGPAAACDAVPSSSAMVGAAFMYYDETARSTQGPTRTGECSGGRITPAPGGVAIDLGYRPPPPPPPPGPAGSPPPDRTAPLLSGLRVRSKRRIEYLLNEPATIGFVVQRRRPGRRVRGSCGKPRPRHRGRRRCVRWVRVRRGFEHAGVAGINSLRIPGRRLRPGRYRLVAKTVTDAAGNPGPRVQARFRVQRRRDRSQ